MCLKSPAACIKFVVYLKKGWDLARGQLLELDLLHPVSNSVDPGVGTGGRALSFPVAFDFAESRLKDIPSEEDRAEDIL